MRDEILPDLIAKLCQLVDEQQLRGLEIITSLRVLASGTKTIYIPPTQQIERQVPGEAEQVQQMFAQQAEQDREAIIAFMENLSVPKDSYRIEISSSPVWQPIRIDRLEIDSGTEQLPNSISFIRTLAISRERSNDPRNRVIIIPTTPGLKVSGGNDYHVVDFIMPINTQLRNLVIRPFEYSEREKGAVLDFAQSDPEEYMLFNKLRALCQQSLGITSPS